jgi:PAS domain S-box-containing protein
MPGIEFNRLRKCEAEWQAETARPRVGDAAGNGREGHQRAIIDSAVDLAIIATDQSGRITDWNKGAERILGWSAAEMRNQLVERFFTPEDRLDDRIGAAMRDALDNGCARDERWHLNKEGWCFWARDETVPLRDDDGAHLGFLKILRDRTQQKLFEVELQTRQAHLSAALAIARLGTFEWDIPTGTLRLDDRSREIFDFRPDQGRCIQEIFDRIDRRDFERILAEAQVSQQAESRWETEYRISLPSGSVRTIVSTSNVAAGTAGKIERLIGVFADITEHKQAEAAVRDLNQALEQRIAARTHELQAAEEQLRQSQKMEAVGQLTGGLTHDFNNLLAIISASLEQLQTQLARGQLHHLEHYVAAAQTASKRAASLAHRLLSFARRQILTPKALDINQLVVGMEDLVRRTMGPQTAVEVSVPSDLWITLVDPNQLENALLNLCINAHHAMPAGGRLTIKTGNISLDEKMAAVHELPAGQYVSLRVTDTGTGIAPEMIKRVFEPFFTTKPVGQGSGLGLSMVYGFARRAGGQVWMDSEPGKGTTVCLYLPRHMGEAEHVATSAELAETPHAHPGGTVLVVDDEPTLRDLVSEALKDLGYTTLEAADGAAGLKVLQSEVHIDLLISDVGLPGGMDGYQMVEIARASHPDLKVLYMTGYDDILVPAPDHSEPDRLVLTKPFAMRELANRIKEIIDVRRQSPSTRACCSAL